MESLADRVLARIREEMAAKKLSQRDIAGLLKWSQGRVAKLMTGRVKITVNDLAALCFAVGLLPSEAVRDRGMEFYAEMTPTELRVLERLRELPKNEHDAILTLLRVRQTLTTPERYAARKPALDARIGKPRTR